MPFLILEYLHYDSVKHKRVTHGELDKMKITKHVNEYGIVNAVVKYKGEFPSLTESPP